MIPHLAQSDIMAATYSILYTFGYSLDTLGGLIVPPGGLAGGVKILFTKSCVIRFGSSFYKHFQCLMERSNEPTKPPYLIT